MNNAITHVLLDIEGTTCPVSFVSDVLFPYASREVAAYLRRHGHEDQVQRLVRELHLTWQQEDHQEARALLAERMSFKGTPNHASETAAGSPWEADPGQSLLPYLLWLIRCDRKVTAWKELQGLIWEEGYARGEIQAQLFPEVAATLKQWKSQGMRLSVYSSGSVAAQKLLYGHCTEGDLRSLFSHWFDTRIGPKQACRSYQQILIDLDTRPEEILFISDSTAELQAASEAGLTVIFSDREGNPQRDTMGFPSISSLEQINLDAQEICP